MHSTSSGDLSCYTRRRRSPESRPLISSVALNPTHVYHRSACCTVGLCIASKAAILVLLWNIFIGGICCISREYTFFFLVIFTILYDLDISLSIVALYSLTAIIFLFYPLSGFLADVCFGRFNTVFVSLTSFTCSVVACLLSVIGINLFNGEIVFLLILFLFCCLCLLIAMISVTGYKANSIQFGLDQLLEAPSQHQALFVHWAKWCYDFMSMISIAVIAFIFCKSDINGAFDLNHNLSRILMFTVTLFFSIPLVILLILGCIKRHWFYSEKRRQNPYIMVIKVLIFAWVHKYPLQRSAFTYCDNERPSRFDYAKESYGGPFTTEQVEDVKTFLRIMIILLAVGPVSILDVATSDTIFLFYGFHIGSEDPYCNLSWIIVNSGLLRYIISTIFLPVYMWIIFSLLRNRTPRILYRLGFGISLYVFGVFSVLIVETIGHLQFDGHQTECIFDFTVNITKSHLFFDVPHLDINWAVFILCNFFVGIGSPLVTVTVFEFISAQSPHSMKGLILGMYYFITGVYQFISSVAIVPFSVLHVESGISSYVGCLFGYILLICVIGTIGFVLFLFASRWYKCRVRQDRPYDQRFVVEVYERYLDQADNTYSYSYESEGD